MQVNNSPLGFNFSGMNQASVTEDKQIVTPQTRGITKHVV